MYNLAALYNSLKQRPGLQNIQFNDTDLQNIINAADGEYFTHPSLYEYDVEELEHELYLNKMYGISLDTPVNQMSPELYAQIMTDPNYAFYAEEPQIGLYANGYRGDRSKEDVAEYSKPYQYWYDEFQKYYV